MNEVSISKYLVVLNSPFFFLWWYEMMKYPHDKMKRGEWHKHSDVMLGYYWPSKDESEGELTASGDSGSLSHDDADGWMSGADNVSG